MDRGAGGPEQDSVVVPVGKVRDCG